MSSYDVDRPRRTLERVEDAEPPRRVRRLAEPGEREMRAEPAALHRDARPAGSGPGALGKPGETVGGVAVAPSQSTRADPGWGRHRRRPGARSRPAGGQPLACSRSSRSSSLLSGTLGRKASVTCHWVGSVHRSAGSASRRGSRNSSSRAQQVGGRHAPPRTSAWRGCSHAAWGKQTDILARTQRAGRGRFGPGGPGSVVDLAGTGRSGRLSGLLRAESPG